MKLTQLYKEILQEELLQEWTVGNNVIIDAIKNRQLVNITYVDEKGNRTNRVIEPYVLGYNKMANLCLRAYQVSGQSVSNDEKIPFWRMFRVDRIYSFKPSNEHFDGSRLFMITNRAEYNKNDVDMSRIIYAHELDSVSQAQQQQQQQGEPSNQQPEPGQTNINQPQGSRSLSNQPSAQQQSIQPPKPWKHDATQTPGTTRQSPTAGQPSTQPEPGQTNVNQPAGVNTPSGVNSPNQNNDGEKQEPNMWQKFSRGVINKVGKFFGKK